MLTLDWLKGINKLTYISLDVYRKKSRKLQYRFRLISNLTLIFADIKNNFCIKIVLIL